jgi:hypothetical protein
MYVNRVIQTQTSMLITYQGKETGHALNTRAYSPQIFKQPSTVGERVAFQTAKIILKDSRLSTHLKSLTKMSLNTSHSEQNPRQRAILASFSGGILLSKGIGFPNAHLFITFRASVSDLTSPTAYSPRQLYDNLNRSSRTRDLERAFHLETCTFSVFRI